MARVEDTKIRVLAVAKILRDRTGGAPGIAYIWPSNLRKVACGKCGVCTTEYIDAKMAAAAWNRRSL